MTWLWGEEKSLVSGAGVMGIGQMNDGEVDGDFENLESTAREVQEEWDVKMDGRVVGSEDGQGEADVDASDTCGSPQNGMHTLAYAVAVGALYDRKGVVSLTVAVQSLVQLMQTTGHAGNSPEMAREREARLSAVEAAARASTAFRAIAHVFREFVTETGWLAGTSGDTGRARSVAGSARVGRCAKSTEIARPSWVAGRAGGPASCAESRVRVSGGSDLLVADHAVQAQPGETALATRLSVWGHLIRARMLLQWRESAGNDWRASLRTVTVKGMTATGGWRFWWFLRPAEWNALMRSLHGSGGLGAGKCGGGVGFGWCVG